MKNIILALTLCTILISCSNYEVEQPQNQPEPIRYNVLDNLTPEISYTPISDSVESCLSGTVFSNFGKPVPFANIVIVKDSIGVTGTQTNRNGEFKICNIETGIYEIKLSAVAFYPAEIKNVEIKRSTVTTINKVVMAVTSVPIDKPIIYLYPEEVTEVEVLLDYAGELTHTYPRYNDGWSVTAHPNGTLFDESGKEFYALYWEGLPNDEFTIEEGFVVAGKQTITFLEVSLAELGLNRKEANEFIIYWLPKLESNLYNLIHFSTVEYEEMAKLEITPTPDSVIRVMMVFKPLTEPVEIKKQDLSKLKKERKGFTVVEWGGIELK